MSEKTDEDLEALVDQIVREHEHNQHKQVEDLYEWIKDKPVSTLIQLVGKRLNERYAEREIKSLLTRYLYERQAAP